MTVVDLRLRLMDEVLADAIADARWLSDAGIAVSTGPADVDAVIVVADAPLPPDEELALLELARRHPVLLVGPTLSGCDLDGPLADAAGLHLGPLTPAHEIRLRAGTEVDPRGEGDVLVRERLTLVEKVAGDVETWITANVAFTDHAVGTWRPSTGIGVLTVGSDPASWSDRSFLRLVHRWVHATRGQSAERTVRVGLLGYGAIGHEHNRAFAAVPGFELAGVCDRAPDRIAAALELAPDARPYSDGEAMLAADDIDLVVVSTPPSSHALWALRTLEADKHVVLEKPMALTTAECDAVLQLAEGRGRTAVVYQNRRWDPDYLALKRAVRSDRIGEVFHVESFVGGYGHPCNYWHSDADISGGAIFDWGSHYLDQLLDLVPREIEYVTGTNHKRVWFDVTNADQARVGIRFEGGVEAEFIHSDLAAAAKPKWYVLGTKGAIVGDWRVEKVVSRTDIGTLAEDVLAPADAPADLSLHDADGSVTRLAVPPAPEHAFHRELADRLLSGLPMTLKPQQSRRVVGVMEAAEASARAGGRPVVPE